MASVAAYDPAASYRVSAGLLTLLVHVVFFGLLYLGVNWKAQQPQGMMVDLWSDLPVMESVPPRAAPAAPPMEEVVKPRAAEKLDSKPEIDLGKKKKTERAKEKEEVKPQPKAKEKQPRESKAMQELLGQAERDEQQSRARQVAGLAAITGEMEKYKGLIRSKVRSKIFLPPGVADQAQVIFEVALLPDGSVLDAVMVRSSGNAAYDDAVARAIRSAQPLPLPQNDMARMQFVNPNRLTLKFTPKD